MKPKKHPVTVYVRKDVLDEFRLQAEKHNRPVSNEMAVALDVALDQYRKEQK